MAKLAPKIGDVVHYVVQPDVDVPAFVMTDGPAKGVLALFVFFTGVNHFARTSNLDSYHAPARLVENVPYAAPRLSRMGTWHWPEHRFDPLSKTPQPFVCTCPDPRCVDWPHVHTRGGPVVLHEYDWIFDAGDGDVWVWSNRITDLLSKDVGHVDPS